MNNPLKKNRLRVLATAIGPLIVSTCVTGCGSKQVEKTPEEIEARRVEHGKLMLEEAKSRPPNPGN